MRSWPDEVASRINCSDLQEWLPGLAQWLDLDEEALLPRDAREEYVLRAPQHGITLTFRHPHAGYSEVADPSRWILVSAHFRHGLNLPFHLDALSETVESAKRRLSGDMVGIPPRVSFFLPDFRVVELVLRNAGQGIEEVTVVRLGREQSWSRLVSSGHVGQDN